MPFTSEQSCHRKRKWRAVQAEFPQYDDLAEMENRYEEMFDRFPESTHCLIIFTPNQFAKDIQSIMPTIAGGTVLYGEQMMPPLEYKNRWEQGLYKRSKFSYQNEFRFIITNSSFDVPFTYKMNNHFCNKNHLMQA